MQFNNSTGQFLEAFFFNIMASADEFLKYFDKIEIYMKHINETGGLDPQIELAWQQRGILFNVVWLSFSPLKSSSRYSIDSYVGDLLKPTEFDVFHPEGSSLKIGSDFRNRVIDYVDEQAEIRVFNKTRRLKTIYEDIYPDFKNQFSGFIDGKRLIFGFMNGVINVFPLESL